MQMVLAATVQRLSTADVARLAGIHKDTLLRWLRARVVPEPNRDRHGWRFFSKSEADAIIAYARSTDETSLATYAAQKTAPYLGRLSNIDWDFADAKTTYLTHGLHPYPAKFIPQIPNALIQELSSVGDTVGDIFCGSGTTLVEALTLKRHAIGIDANPLASLISKAKTGVISENDAIELTELVHHARTLGESLAPRREGNLFPSSEFASGAWRPPYEKLNFWFEPYVVEELAESLAWCRRISTEPARTLALAAFSAIVVAVSKQDSDTRYVRREKNIPPGDTFKRFARSVEQSVRAAVEYAELIEPRFRCDVVTANLLELPEIPQLDLMVCSPPYPNAYSYHLYHMTRMIWLGMDQPKFKREEIGSHRKYSSKGRNGATVDTFKAEFEAILRWLSRSLKKGGYACFVVGDSTLKGLRVSNANLISEIARDIGFSEALRIDRTMQDTKKAFNPAIGKIKTEKILILENRGAMA
jgi:site-specific DNA-methyltransferase (cytosine-N4-specific)